VQAIIIALPIKEKGLFVFPRISVLLLYLRYSLLTRGLEDALTPFVRRDENILSGTRLKYLPYKD